jgi:hypothetical protein
MSHIVQKVQCQCGKVQLEARGTPIVTTICHCSGCMEAGHILENIAGAAPILDANDGTSFELFRKDRVMCVSGADKLREHRLKDTSPTRRVVATCCNSFMFLDFTKGHWVSIAHDRIVQEGSVVVAPSEGRQSFLFIARLMVAWATMGFRTPTIDYVNGELEHA